MLGVPPPSCHNMKGLLPPAAVHIGLGPRADY